MGEEILQSGREGRHGGQLQLLGQLGQAFAKQPLAVMLGKYEIDRREKIVGLGFGRRDLQDLASFLHADSPVPGPNAGLRPVAARQASGPRVRARRRS